MYMALFGSTVPAAARGATATSAVATAARLGLPSMRSRGGHGHVVSGPLPLLGHP